MFSGVSRLAGSLTMVAREIGGFADDPAALHGGVETGERGRSDREGIDRFLVVARLVAVRFEIAQNGAFHGGGGEVGGWRSSPSRSKCDLLDRFGFQEAQGRPGELRRISAGVELLGLARSGQQDPRGGHSGEGGEAG